MEELDLKELFNIFWSRKVYIILITIIFLLLFLLLYYILYNAFFAILFFVYP